MKSITYNVEVQNTHHLIIYARKNGILRVIHNVNAVEWNNFRTDKIKLEDLNIPDDDKKWLQDEN